MFALGRSFDMLVTALGGDRDRVGDAIYGALTSALVTMKDPGNPVQQGGAKG